jgi:hypothetical protein
MLAVLLMATLKTLVEPATFWGALFITIAGTLIAALFAWCSVLAWNALQKRLALVAYFSEDAFEEAVNKGFGDSICKKQIVCEGVNVLVFGVAPKTQLRLRSFDVRPVTRSWRKWTNLKKPMPVVITRMRVDQLDWRRRGFTEETYSPWANDFGGFGCEIPLKNQYIVLEADHAIWLELTLEASLDWRGALSFTGYVLDGETLCVRRRITVRADHNVLMDSV